MMTTVQALEWALSQIRPFYENCAGMGCKFCEASTLQSSYTALEELKHDIECPWIAANQVLKDWKKA